MTVPFLDIHTHRAGGSDPAIYNLDQQEIRAMVASAGTAPDKTAPDGTPPPPLPMLSAGIHPWDVAPETIQQDLQRLHKLAGLAQVRLIGECGLDQLKGPGPDLQKEAFAAQIRIANAHNKPLIIHCVKAYDALIAVTKAHPPKVPVIIHGFNKGSELARQLGGHGFLLSFGAALLKPAQLAGSREKQAERPATLALRACWHRGQPFFLETDNSGQHIQEIYGQAAKLLKISVEALKDVIFASWEKVGLNHE